MESRTSEMIAFPKPQRQKKERKPLKRSPIKAGRRCPECRGKGYSANWKKISINTDDTVTETVNNGQCSTCNGSGRVPSKPLSRSTKPIRRSSKPIKRSVDHAEFDKRLLTKVVWQNDEPFSTFGEPCDFHHVLGRGGGNKLFSSPYNAIPLPRSVHEKGWINWPEARALFLKLARRQVDKAIERGLYEATDNDAAFLEYADQQRLNFMYDSV